MRSEAVDGAIEDQFPVGNRVDSGSPIPSVEPAHRTRARLVVSSRRSPPPRHERSVSGDSPSPTPERAGELGVAPTMPASMAKSGSPLPSPPETPVNRMERSRVLSALFETPVEETRMGRYVVRGTLGEGGMGTVLEAVDPGLDRRVALKVLHRELDERHTMRLRREAQALAKLSHPNVVQVYEVGEVEGQTFVAMEKIKGLTLREWMRREPRPGWRECVEVYLQVGAGLVAAHEQGLVHRDSKPANAIIDAKGRVRVLDFGLARRTEDADVHESGQVRTPVGAEDSAVLDATLTRTGAVLGTPAYMPLEQMAGGEADARSDQFSFCVSLYEAIYGERPFEGTTLPALMVAMRHGELRPVPKGTKVPARLRSTLARGLSCKPRERWPSMDALMAELRGLLEVRRRGALPVLGVVGGALGVLGLGLWGQGDVGTGAEPVARDAAMVARGTDEEPQPSPNDRALPPTDDQDATKASSVTGPGSELAIAEEIGEPEEQEASQRSSESEVGEREPEPVEKTRAPVPATESPKAKTRHRPKRKPKLKSASPAPQPLDTAPTPIHDTLTREDMRPALVKARTIARRCGAKHRTLMAEVVVRVEVEADGKVQSVEVLPPAKGSAEAGCLVTELSGLRFPRSLEGGDATWALKLW